MQAKPIKPFYEEYIEQNIVHIDCFSKIYIDYSDFLLGPVSDKDHQIVMDRLKEKGVNILTLHEKWIDIEGYWKASPLRAEQTLKIVEEAHKRGIKVMAYFCSSISTLRPESEDYIERNAHIDGNGNYVISHYRQPPQRTIRVCGNGREVYRDLTDGMQEAADRFGFDGVYMDSADIPWECTNAKHGCGYEDQFGLRRPTYPISALREEFMEIYERFSAQGKIVHLHSYSAFIPAVHAFCDMYWNGEQLHFSKMYGELTNTPLEFIKTECLGRNIGVPCQFLAYEMGDKWNFEMALSLTAVHGIYPRPNDVNHPLDVMSQVWRVLHEFDVAHSEWLPYWEGGGLPVTAGDSNVLISAYIKGNDILAVIANPNDKAAENIRLSAEGAVSVSDALTGEQISSDEMFTLSLPRFSMKMILIKKS
ncbi:MAG: DUF6067 family protein [Eubacteriales bacterium]|nr:DUF6067 family protein [Eubacteriales bacterium]